MRADLEWLLHLSTPAPGTVPRLEEGHMRICYVNGFLGWNSRREQRRQKDV